MDSAHGGMAKIRVMYVKAFRDRHGKQRHYFRRRGFATVALPGDPGSIEFAEAYKAALASGPREIGADRTAPGSFAALIVDFYKSAGFLATRPITQRTYRNTLERFRVTFGDMPVRAMTPRKLDELLDAMADRPGARDVTRKVLRLILKLAVRREMIRVSPMDGVRLPRKAVAGFRSWTEDEIAAFEAHWPSGTRERLALALLLYTGQRRSDVVRMGRQHITGATIRVVQQKTGTPLTLPLHAALQREIEAAPVGHLTFLTTAYGAPFSPAGFTNWFRDKIKDAGLPADCKPHGLRKAAAVRLADAGATPSQIMAVTGHANLSEVTHYTAGADQARLARSAMRRLKK